MARERDGEFDVLTALLAGMPVWMRFALIMSPILTTVFFMGQSAGVVPSVAQKQTESLQRLEGKIDNHERDMKSLVERSITAYRIACENSARAAKSQESFANCANIK